MILAASGIAVLGEASPVRAAQPRVTLCHRTRSTTNPYRLITVAQGGLNGHGTHVGTPTDRVWNSSLANGDSWGDIIPGSDDDGDLFWSDGSGQSSAAENWNGSTTSGGKSFMLSGGTNVSKCVRMSALRFYEVMKAANVSDADIATDLNQQSANEDAAVKPSGGWTASNVASAVGGVSIKTNSPTAIGTTSATLSGTITAGSTSTTPKFEYGTTTSLGTTVSGGSASTGTFSATASLTGLTASTTYYYRVIGEIGSADTLGTYYGDILSFTTGKTLRNVTLVAGSTAIGTGESTSLSTTVTAGSPAATTYTIESGTLYCSISGSTLTASATGGTCKVRADDAGDSTYSPSTSATVTITVTQSRTLSINASSYGGSPYAFNVATKPTITSTASAGDTTGTKSYSSSTTPVCTINSSSGLVAFVSAGTCTITASITASGVYASATSSSASFTISPLSRTLTLSGDSGPYVRANTPPTMSATASAGSGTITYSSSTTSVCTVNSSSGAVAWGASDGDCSISASIAQSGEYASATATTRTFSLSAAALTSRTLAMGSLSSSYAFNVASKPSATATASPDDTGTKTYSSLTTSVCTVNSSSGLVAFVTAGTCTITASIGSSGSYASANATSPVSFTITPISRNLTLSGDSGPYQLSATPPTMSASPSAGAGTITYSSSTTSVCTVNSSSGVVEFVTTGTCTISASVDADAGYEAKTSSDRTFSITANSRTLTIDASSYDSSYDIGDDEPTITSTASAGGGSKSYSSSTTSVCTIDSSSGAVTFVAAGTCTISASISANGSHATATSASISFTITSTTTTTSPPAAPAATTTTTVAPTTTIATSTNTTSTSSTTTTTINPRRITICHATAPGRYVQITVDRNGLNGHGNHSGDIIPAPAGGCPGTASTSGTTSSTSVDPNSTGTSVGTRATTTTSTIAVARTTVPPGKITICHATGAGTFVQITVDRSGLNGHGDHLDDIIPAPAEGCPYSIKQLALNAITTTSAPSTETTASTRTTVDRGKITICHATSAGFYVEITVDRSGLNGHGDHDGDIIPAPATGCPGGVVVSTTVPRTTVPPGKISICHATGAGIYVQITVDRSGLNGHGDHDGDIIPAPDEGCPSRVNRQSDPSTTTTLPRGKVAICHALGDGKFTRLMINRSDLSDHEGHINDIIPAPANGCPGDPTSSTTTTTTTIPCLDDEVVNNFDETSSLTEGLKVTSNSLPDDPNSGTIKISAPSSGPAISLSGVESTDPNVKVTVKSSGVDYNKPITWMNEGYGLFCWKLEPFGSGDYVYTLPNPPSPPDSRYLGLAYSTVIVKAGSLTTTDPNYQVNTLFYNPEPGTGVFADVNKNGISDPGGQGGGSLGDKSISHIVLCVGEAAVEPVATSTTAASTSTTAAFLTTTTTINWAAPFCSSTTTTIRTATTAAPSSSASTTTTTTTTTTVPGSSTSTTVGGSTTTIAGSTTTTTIGGSSSTTTTTVAPSTTTTVGSSTTTTTTGGSSSTTTTTTTIAGSTTSTTVGGSTTTTVGGSTTTTIAGSSTTSTTISGSTTTTVGGSTTSSSIVVPTTSGPGSPTPEPPIEFLVQAESVPESGVVDLVLTLTNGATSEVVFMRVDVKKFEVVADSLPVTGVERWSDSQRMGWYLIAFGLFFMLIPLRKRAALRR